MRRLGVYAIVMVCVMSFAIAFGDAVVTTSVYSGDPYSNDSTFYVDVTITSNDTGQECVSYGLRIWYDGDQLSLTGAADVDFGAAPTMGPVETDPGTGKTFRDIAQSTSIYEGLSEGTLFRLTFLTGTLTGPYDIEIADDPDSSGPLYGHNWANIPHTFDNTLTQALPVELDWMIVE